MHHQHQLLVKPFHSESVQDLNSSTTRVEVAHSHMLIHDLSEFYVCSALLFKWEKCKHSFIRSLFSISDKDLTTELSCLFYNRPWFKKDLRWVLLVRTLKFPGTVEICPQSQLVLVSGTEPPALKLASAMHSCLQMWPGSFFS